MNFLEEYLCTFVGHIRKYLLAAFQYLSFISKLEAKEWFNGRLSISISYKIPLFGKQNHFWPWWDQTSAFRSGDKKETLNEVQKVFAIIPAPFSNESSSMGKIYKSRCCCSPDDEKLSHKLMQIASTQLIFRVTSSQ